MNENHITVQAQISRYEGRTAYFTTPALVHAYRNADRKAPAVAVTVGVPHDTWDLYGRPTAVEVTVAITPLCPNHDPELTA